MSLINTKTNSQREPMIEPRLVIINVRVPISRLVFNILIFIVFIMQSNAALMKSGLHLARWGFLMLVNFQPGLLTFLYRVA
jgi:hypothetical protein